MGPAEQSTRAGILLGTGVRMEALARVLTPSITGLGVRSAVELEDLESAAGGAALVLDADAVPFEDLGYLRRLVERSGARLHVTGPDPSQRVARGLLRIPGARWMCWPPDLDEILELCSSPRPAGKPVAAPDSRAPRSAVAETPADERQNEIEAIERVLGMRPAGPRATHPASSAPASAPTFAELPSSTVEIPPSVDPARSSAPTPADARRDAPIAQPPPHSKYFRHQVADLADIAQRIDLGIKILSDRLPEAGDGPPAELGAEPLSALSGDVARLVQFTRTLGYLAAPPPPGEHVFDLSEMIEWCVSSLVSSGPKAPRGLFRTTGPLRVRSDRALLAQAFDAIFYLAQSASGSGEIVRVELSSYDLAGRSMARVSIQFPAGPLVGWKPAQILEPYAVRRILPELGPNALSAAVAILESQGGHASLEELARSRLQWVITLPREVESATPSAGVSDAMLAIPNPSPHSDPVS